MKFSPLCQHLSSVSALAAVFLELIGPRMEAGALINTNSDEAQWPRGVWTLSSGGSLINTNTNVVQREAWGTAQYGIRPFVLAHGSRPDGPWTMELEFQAQGTNYEANYGKGFWLRLTNSTGSKIELRLTDGTVLHSTNPDMLAPENTPKRVRINELFDNYRPHSRVGMLWIELPSGRLTAASSFVLIRESEVPYEAPGIPMREIFRGVEPPFAGLSVARDYILKVTPLLYKVREDGVTADLVEFAPIELRLPALKSTIPVDQNRKLSAQIRPPSDASPQPTQAPTGIGEKTNRYWIWAGVVVLVAILAFLAARRARRWTRSNDETMGSA
jgi:hypothetical protein